MIIINLVTNIFLDDDIMSSCRRQNDVCIRAGGYLVIFEISPKHGILVSKTADCISGLEKVSGLLSSS